MKTMTKQCACSTPDRGAYLVCRRCGGEYGGEPRAATAPTGGSMTTERMTELDKALASLGFTHDVSAARNELATLRRVEQEQAEKIRKLEDTLRLTNDKMAEQVRQALHDFAVEIISSYAANYRDHFNLVMEIAHKVRDANAPKD